MSSTTTTLNDLLPQIVAEAMFVAGERSIMRGLVKNYNLTAGQGKTVTVPRYPRQTAATVAEGGEVPNTAVSTDSAVLTVSTAAIRTLVTDLAVASAASNVVADIGRLFGEAIARKMDTDLTGLFAGFATGSGAHDTAITPAAIFRQVALLRSQAVPMDQMVCVVHPSIAFDLKAALTTQGNTPFVGDAGTLIANEAMREGFVGRLAGIPVFETANMADTGTASEFTGGIFHADALGLAMIGDIGIETERRARFLGTDIVGHAHFGVGPLQPTYGQFLKFESSII